MDSFLDKLLRWLRYKKIIGYIPKNAVLCDLGCGKGASFLKNISELIKRGIGLDSEIEDYKDSKLELKKFRIEKTLPLENEICDAITMMAAIEHLSYPQEVLNECFRCLKAGGKLILTTPTPASKPILEFLAKISLIDRKEIADHKKYFKGDDLRKLLSEAGFKNENIRNYFFEFFLNNLIIAKK